MRYGRETLCYKVHMRSKKQTQPKLTDAERPKRFVEMAREVEASELPKAFDRAFKRVTAKSNRLVASKKP
jgi:hypothetical protein